MFSIMPEALTPAGQEFLNSPATPLTSQGQWTGDANTQPYNIRLNIERFECRVLRSSDRTTDFSRQDRFSQEYQIGHYLNNRSGTMTIFRPCIDLHSGSVKQIVGGTLTTNTTDLKTNYVSSHSAGHFAQLYKDHGLRGSHVIMLGPGNEEAAQEACQAWPRGLQVGGGITDQNAQQWIEWGAEKV